METRSGDKRQERTVRSVRLRWMEGCTLLVVCEEEPTKGVGGEESES